MKLLDESQTLPESSKPRVVTIGAYDGVHRGHQAIFAGVVRRARELGGSAVAMTFRPHPQRVVSPGDAPALLQTNAQQHALLEACGIDYLVALAFSRELSLLTPAQFVRDLLRPWSPAEIHVGWNFRFGHRRSGGLDDLRLLGEQFGFTVVSVPPVSLRGLPISSSRIRREIANGNVSLAGRMLGRPYEIRGVVVRGERLGSQLGFPTINLESANEALPGVGVYAARVRLATGEHLAAVNVGFRPTVERHRNRPLVEAHLLSFDGDLYGHDVALEFCFRLRGEKRFPDLGALKGQIARDVERSRRYFEAAGRAVPRAGERWWHAGGLIG